MNTMILAIGILLLAFIVIMVYKLKQSPQGKKKIMAATAVAITLGGAGVYSVTNQAVTADDFFQVLYDNTASCGGDIVCRGAFVFENVDAANIDIEFTFEYLNGSDASAEISDYSVYVSSDTCFEPDPTTTTIETTSTIKESTTTTTASSTASFDVVYVYPDDFVLPNNTLRANSQVNTDVKEKCKNAKYNKKTKKIKSGEKILAVIEANKTVNSIIDWKAYVIVAGVKVKQDKWAIWGKGTVTPSNNLVQLLRMDELSGTTVADYSGKSNTGTTGGTVTHATAGVFNKSKTFSSASAGFITTAGTTGFPTGAMRWAQSLWFKPTTTIGWLVTHGPSGTSQNQGFNIAKLAGNQLYFNMFNATAPQESYNSGLVGLGVWNHVYVAYNGSKVLVYVNGTLTKTITPISGFSLASGRHTYGIYADSITNPYDGVMDDMAFWNYSVGNPDSVAMDLFRSGLTELNITQPIDETVYVSTPYQSNTVSTVGVGDITNMNITYTVNGTGYRMHSKDSLLLFNFDNRAQLGESSSLVVGGTGRSFVPSATFTLVGGVYGKALKSTGAGGLDTNSIGVAVLPKGVGKPWTISSWVKPSIHTSAVLQSIYGEYVAGSSQPGTVMYGWYNGISYACVRRGATIDVCYNGLTLPINDWSMYTLVYNGTHIRQNVNGVSGTSNVVAINNTVLATVGYIGSTSDATQGLNGTIDQLIIVNYSMSDEEIRFRYEGNYLTRLNNTHYELNGTHTFNPGTEVFTVDACGGNSLISCDTKTRTYVGLPMVLTVTSPANATYTNATRIPLDVDVQVGVPSNIEVSVPNKVASRTPDYFAEEYGGMYLYRFEGDLTDSWSSNDATSTALTYADGKFGKGAFFHGYNALVNISNADLKMDTFTVSTWLKPDITTNGKYLYEAYVPAAANRGFYIYGSADLFRAVYGNSAGSYSYFLTTNLTLGEWSHLVYVRNTTGATCSERFCLNGVCMDESVCDKFPIDYTGTKGAVIGGSMEYPTGYGFNGTIDDFAIYSTPLSVDVIQDLYNTQRLSYLDDDTVLYMDFEEYDGAEGDATGQVAQYHLDEASGTVVTDTSGHTETGANVGATVNQAGKYDKAYSFDGQNDYVNLTLLNLEYDFTISVWVSSLNNTGVHYILGNRDGASKWILFYLSNGYFYGQVRDDTQAKIVKDDTAIADGFNHVVLSRSATELKMYVNGIQVAVNDTSAIGAVDSVNVFKIGIRPDSPANYFQGLIDELNMYNRTLSDDEVKQLYLGGNAIDHSNYENEGAIVGAVNTTGKYGSGMFVNGSKIDLIYSPMSWFQPQTNFGFGGWAKYESYTSGNSYIVSNGWNNAPPYVYWGVTRSSSSAAKCFISDNLARNECLFTSPITFTDWNHYYCNFDGTTIYNYLNGRLDNTCAVAAGAINYTALRAGTPLGIGSWSNYSVANSFRGWVDNAVVHDRFLSQEEINNMYLTDLRWHNDTHWTLTPELDVEDYGELYYDFEEYYGQPYDSTFFTAEYHMEGLTDSSGNGNTLAATGDPTVVTTACKYGSCYEFDGDDYLTLSGGGSVISAGDNDNTVCFWMNFTGSPSGLYGVISLGDTSVNQYNINIYNDALRFRTYYDTGSTTYVHGAVTQGRWYHLCMVVDNGVRKSYVDGELVDTDSAQAYKIPPTPSLEIATYDTSSYEMTGLLDEVMILDFALSDGQVQQLYLGGKVPDASLNINEGDIVGAYNTTGKYGSGIYLDGTDGNYIQSSSDDFRPTNMFSLGAWVKHGATSSTDVIASTYLSNDGYVIDFTSADIFRYVQYNNTGSGGYCIASATGAIPDNTWTHVFATIDSNQLISLYVDGVLNSTTQCTGDVYYSSTNKLTLGRYPTATSNRVWNGTLDDFRYFDRTLSATEIAGIYAERSPSWGTTKNITFTACNTAGFCTSELRMTAFGDESVNITVWDGAAYVADTDIQFRCTPTQTDCAATNQDASNGIYNMQNNGTFSADLGMKLTAVCTDIAVKCDTDNDPTGATVLTAAYQTISAGVAADASDEIWCWADYSNPSTGCQFTTEVQYTHTPT